MSAAEGTTSAPAQATGLPGNCPSWCDQRPEGHQQAADEGCPVDIARVHRAGDLVGRSESGGERLNYSLWLLADPGEQPTFWGLPVLELETSSRGEQGGRSTATTRLTTAAARVLARQLVHFADLADLER